MHRLCLLAVLVCACSPRVSVTPLRAVPGAPRPPRPVDDVALLMTGSPAGATELFLLKAEGGAEPRRLEALRHRAAELGCDAVVITSNVPDASTSTRVTTSTSTSSPDGAAPVQSTQHATVENHTMGYVMGVCILLPSAPSSASSAP